MGRGQPFKIPIAKNTVRGPETSNWFWHPDRVGVKMAPWWFSKRLKEEFGPDTKITWNPIKERWLVWQRDVYVQHKLCQGWRLLFMVEWEGEYVPLDERVFAVLYSRWPQKHGGCKRYWDRLVSEIERDKEKGERDHVDEIRAKARERWDYMAIKNIGKGNKFSEHHAGG